MFSIGISDWPPASTLALSRRASSPVASGPVGGAEYKEWGRPGNRAPGDDERMQVSLMRRWVVSLWLTLALGAPALADPVEDFYRGRSVTLLIGYTVAGGYDTYARVLAHHLGRHIPGNPTIVPQNMAGAGSQRAP